MFSTNEFAISMKIDWHIPYIFTKYIDILIINLISIYILLPTDYQSFIKSGPDMRLIFTLVIFFSLITLGYSDPKEKYKPKTCTTKHCSDWDWKNKKGLFDPHSIRWPLHYNGETYLDRVDGGDVDIDVAFNHYGHHYRLPLRKYRGSTYHKDPWFLDKGLDMHDAFVCEAWVEDEPTWDANYCSMIVSTYEDRPFYADGPSCGKIIREWTVIDWCKYEPNTVTNSRPEKYSLVKDVKRHEVYWAYGKDRQDIEHDGWYSFQQVIKILDEHAPALADCSNLEYDVEGDCHAKIKIKNKVIDSGPCPGINMRVEYVVTNSEGRTVASDWISTKNEREFWVNLGYLVADHYEIHWTITDGCNNLGKCVQKLKVLDKNPPHLICLQDLSTAISDDSGVSIWAKDFVHKIMGPCHDNNLTYSFFPDSIATSLHFDCPDGVGLNNVEVYVTSGNGVQVSCNASIFVADHAACEPESMQIAGVVTDRFRNPIKGTEISVMAEESYINSAMSNEYGVYGVKGISFDLGRPQISASFKTDEKTKGLDGVDLIYMLRHIQGIEALKKTDQRAAADINSDGVIDMNDYWDLVHLIYTIPGRATDEITPWKFFDEKLLHFGTTNATRLVSPVKIARYRHQYSLIGIKTGDLDFSWKPGEVASNRSGIKSSDYHVIATDGGNIYEVEVPSFGEIRSVSLSANDLSQLDIISISAAGQPLAYVVEQDENGQNLIILSQSNLAGLDLVITTTESINLTNNGTLYEGVEAEGTMIIDWQLSSSTIVEKSLMTVSPNPFDSDFLLSINQNDAANGIIQIYSAQGQMITQQDVALSAGMNEQRVDGSSLNSGLYIVVLKTAEQQFVSRIIKN